MLIGLRPSYWLFFCRVICLSRWQSAMFNYPQNEKSSCVVLVSKLNIMVLPMYFFESCWLCTLLLKLNCLFLRLLWRVLIILPLHVRMEILFIYHQRSTHIEIDIHFVEKKLLIVCFTYSCSISNLFIRLQNIFQRFSLIIFQDLLSYNYCVTFSFLKYHCTLPFYIY